MKHTAALLATSAVAAGGFGLAGASAAQADFDFERERSVMCKNSNAIASLSLEKEFGNRIEVDFEVENAVPNRTWNVRIKHDGRNTLRTQRATDFEGELDVIHNVRDRRGQDRIVVRAKSTTGEVCRVKLSI
jgi:hypothetical protein